uniref:Uncharacterized protein n=1 Tax=Oryza barthii TaxID=65489 RepID=A0A0D3GM63_9ORYZ
MAAPPAGRVLRQPPSSSAGWNFRRGGLSISVCHGRIEAAAGGGVQLSPECGAAPAVNLTQRRHACMQARYSN